MLSHRLEDSYVFIYLVLLVFWVFGHLAHWGQCGLYVSLFFRMNTFWTLCIFVRVLPSKQLIKLYKEPLEKTSGLVSAQPCKCKPVCDSPHMQYWYLDTRGQVLLYSLWSEVVLLSLQRRGHAPVVLLFLVPSVQIHHQRFQACSCNYSYFLSWCCISSIGSILLYYPPSPSTFPRLLWDGPTVISQFQPSHIGNAYTQIITCSQTHTRSHKRCVWYHPRILPNIRPFMVPVFL